MFSQGGLFSKKYFFSPKVAQYNERISLSNFQENNFFSTHIRCAPSNFSIHFQPVCFAVFGEEEARGCKDKETRKIFFFAS